MDVCGSSATGLNDNGWVQKNFVEASEINSAFSQQETYINNLNQQTRTELTNYVDRSVANSAVDLTEVKRNIAANTQVGILNTSDISTISGRVNQLDAKIVTTDNRVDALENRAAATEAKDIVQDGRLDVLEARSSVIEQKDIQQDARLDDHDDQLSKLKRSTEDKNADQDSRLDDHDRQLKEHSNRLDDHDKQLAEHKEQLIDHENRLNNVEKGIGDLNDNVVFYDRDENGKKKGGLTLDDGSGKEVRISNVAVGKAGTDAVNVDQLRRATDALGGGAKVNEDGTINAPNYNVGGVVYQNVGDALKATNALGVQYVADENGKPTNTVRLTGTGTGPVKITNLADGEADSDAATVRQVKTVRQNAHDYTDSRISELTRDSQQQFASLSGEISQTRQESRAGIAGAMAAAALRFDPRPGKFSIAGGMGGFKSTTALSTGFGYTSLDGDWRINAALAHSFSTNDTSWNVGASYTFN
ncbi:YadA-like family protein [Brucella pseudogrignonensis]|uniref:YadA-like family protein n=1 Tax=Brucella pseudogrignonensis TaxID=419475 RepID=UPI0038D23943